MKPKTHKRSPLLNRTAGAAAALLLGGGGLAAVNFYASAGTSNDGDSRKGAVAQQASTIACPDVVDRLEKVPRQSRKEVSRELGRLDAQIGAAYKRLVENRRAAALDASWTKNSVLDPLASKRRASLDRIRIALERAGVTQAGLEKLARCGMKDGGTVRPGDGQQDGGQQGGGEQDGGQDGGQQDGQNGGQGDGGQGEGEAPPPQIGPSPEDFVDINDVQPNVQEPEAQENASTGVFKSDCGVNENGKFNSDNIIVAPGVVNAAHHMHDYVGNQANDAFAVDEDLAQGETTCANQEDQSTYYWPVLRDLTGGDEADVNTPGGGLDGNVGKIITPAEVTMEFQGSPVGEVVEMPRFLRIITGDAKAFTNGTDNANSSWSCTGFEDRQIADKYPLCPEGSQVVRTFEFQSCWDGQNADSANHRTHVDFANEDGSCDEGFVAIPKLVQRIVYDVPEGTNFAVDSFPEQLHKPVTDHGDFINVFSENLMAEAVECINSGQECT
ncbi:DUF1996 domain-containing protein [Streptomyces xinghaiensis]|uniref:DUF1996 domain-containing protein n=1 Tax=Streptomyces sp. S07_1.15 TaxID=2873925 RepID=UPI001D15B5C2|nr:DUF1996 domain-containing protein [Streptomyces sp. S07_1.15]WSQ71123.1 DUF1996 domain-containing protein [Streptomyces xinghaiensis]